MAPVRTSCYDAAVKVASLEVFALRFRFRAVFVLAENEGYVRMDAAAVRMH